MACNLTRLPSHFMPCLRQMRQTPDHFRRTVYQPFFDNFYASASRFSATNSSTRNGSEYTFTSVVESGWKENELVLRAIMPGVTQNSLKVSAQSTQLILEVERKAPEGWTSGMGAVLAGNRQYDS